MCPDGAQLEPAADEIAREIRRIHKDAYGTHTLNIEVLTGADTIVVVTDVEMTTAEQTLIAGGHPDAVARAREAYHKAMEATFTAVVERAVGRRVASFLSSMCVDPPYIVESFRLAPQAEA